MQDQIVPVILCGGAGSRLWPLSTAGLPKPFQLIGDGPTLFQKTCERLAPLGAPMVVCGEAHVAAVQRQATEAGVEIAAVVAESEAGGTAAAASLAALAARDLALGDRILLAPADHDIDDAAAFRETVTNARSDDRIVLFSVPPRRPETGYGYIRAGRTLTNGLRAVDAFVEKPPQAQAQALLEDGDWGWSAGLLQPAAEVLNEEVERHAPTIAHHARDAWTRADRSGDVHRLPPAGAGDTRSLDRAVIEHSDRLAVALLDCGWSDVGSWDDVWRSGPHDDDGNRFKGPVLAVDSGGCLAWTDGPPVKLIGVNDLVVVATAGGVLVMPKDRAQDLGRLPPGDPSS